MSDRPLTARWTIRSYGPQNLGGQLLLETWHTSEGSRFMELQVYKERMKRGEVSRVEVLDHETRDWSKVVTTYNDWREL